MLGILQTLFGQPWHCKTKANYDWVGKKVTVLSKGKKVIIQAGVSGELIPMVSHIQAKKGMKNSACSCMFVCKLDKLGNEDTTDYCKFLNEFKGSFLLELPKTGLKQKKPSCWKLLVQLC